MTPDQREAVESLRRVDEAFCRFFSVLDIADTRASSALDALPRPADDIPAQKGRLIAFDVSNALRRLAR